MDIKFSNFDNLLELVSSSIKEKIGKKNLIPKKEVITEEVVKPKYEEITLDLERVSEHENFYKPIEVNLDLTETKVDVEDVEEKSERMPEIYPSGLVHGTYIIGQNELGMYIIDQHAAKERINYEYYKEKLGNPKKETTSLLFPFTIELTNSEFIILKEHFNLLEEIGFEVKEFGLNSVIIRSHPTWLPIGFEEVSTRKIIEIILMTEKNFSVTKFNEKIAITLSCKLAIKANENITIEEQEQLINDLRRCENPFNCPHGRPTAIKMSKIDIEKKFSRR